MWLNVDVFKIALPKTLSRKNYDRMKILIEMKTFKN